jgi:hypothetical protein
MVVIPLPLPGPRSRRRCRNAHDTTVSVRQELGSPDTRVLAPGDLGGTAAHAIHAHALGSGRHVDNVPVLGCAVVGLAHAAALLDAAGDVVCLVVVAHPGRGGAVGSAVSAWAFAAAVVVVVVDVDFEVVAV